MEKKILVGTKAILKKGDQFLIIKENSDGFIFWDLPGGKIEYNENPYDCIKREIKEELSIDVDVIRIIGAFYIIRKKDYAFVINIIIECIPKNENFDLSSNPANDENILEYKWVTKEEFLKKEYEVYHNSLKEEIKKVL